MARTEGTRLMEKGSVQAGDARLSYSVMGEGPPWCCCTASSPLRTAGEGWCPHLARKHRVYAVDAWASGGSDRCPEADPRLGGARPGCWSCCVRCASRSVSPSAVLMVERLRCKLRRSRRIGLRDWCWSPRHIRLRRSRSTWRNCIARRSGGWLPDCFHGFRAAGSNVDAAIVMSSGGMHARGGGGVSGFDTGARDDPLSAAFARELHR